MSERSDREVAPPRCVEALAARQEELLRALDGRSLRVLIECIDGTTLRVLLTRGGFVGVVPAEQSFEPQVEIRGPADEVRAFLGERTSLADALLARLVILRIPEDEVAGYRDLRRLVADVVAALD